MPDAIQNRVPARSRNQIGIYIRFRAMSELTKTTLDQNPQLRRDATRDASCKKIYSERASTRGQRRPALDEAMTFLRRGDTLVVWKLDRLARSLSQLIETIDRRNAADIGFHSPTEKLDTATIKAAGAMLRDPDLTIREIAEQLDLSRSTLYRHFQAARTQPD